MEDFEEKIKPFVKKIVDEDNPQIVKYKPSYRIRTTSINLLDPKQAKKMPGELPPNCTKSRGVQGVHKKVKTPDGIFNSIREAAEHYQVSGATVAYRCTHWTPHEFFFYEE